MIDRVLVMDRLDRLGRYLAGLEGLKALGRSDFLANERNVAAAESYLRRALESIFDIGRHILARTGGIDLAAEYKSIASGLGGRGVISKALAESLVLMAGYRNRLVHLYHLISDEELWDIIISDLDDIKDFIAAVLAYLDATGSPA